MDTKAIATMQDGSKVSGRLTTDHAASSYNQPVFVDDNNQAYNWSAIADIQTTSAQSKGGSRPKATSAENGRKGGRPKGSKNKAKGAS